MNDLVKDFILPISVIKELNYNFASWKDQLRESNFPGDLMNKIRSDILKRREFVEKHFKERVRLADANADSMESRRGMITYMQNQVEKLKEDHKYYAYEHYIRLNYLQYALMKRSSGYDKLKAEKPKMEKYNKKLVTTIQK
ncbi:hypothetical protein OROGR_028969 [Orobanche gracilis]